MTTERRDLLPGTAVRVAGFSDRAVVAGEPERVGPLARYPVARCADELKGEVVTRTAVAEEISEADEPFPAFAVGDRVRVFGAAGIIEAGDDDSGLLVVRFRVTRAGGAVARERRHRIPRWRLALIATRAAGEPMIHQTEDKHDETHQR